ncbi:MFS transporter [Paenibacillus sp. TRM 82003]|uniref:MFS transporter n=1 Tax=Kineococcus sp. TRM81007 TaxID=2925831 RepID=UPI001F56D398|nr:MFS transporter [Kineococcus sp. TRM81007]MCI2239932.1 MFS transporter [Kineococcus sp. TRM81007]MCI3925763.1 MFS transporter [Paenibacillus sp. TRM 82003]
MALSNEPRVPVAPGTPAVPAAPPGGARGARGLVVRLTLAQFGLFVALMAPVMVSLALKAQQVRPDDPASVVGTVSAWAAFGAFIANPLFGMLSDRTRSRFGRRRPWILGGLVVFTLALVWVAFTDSVLQLGVAWVLAQMGANAVLACLVAVIADQVPAEQRAGVSSWVGIAQNVAILLATLCGALFPTSMLPLFLVPAGISFVLVAAFALTMRDEPHPEAREPLDLKAFARTFYTNPVAHPDFALAWWSRFFIVFGTFMFTTYRLLYLQHRFGLDAAAAARAVLLGVLVYTAALVVAARAAGWASDRTGRRKPFVFASTALFAAGLVVLAHAGSVGAFYVAEVVLGVAYGVYVAVDTALVIDVLPSEAQAGKDLGVFNMANALPQSLAPAAALVLLGVGSAANQNYQLMLWGAGAVTVLGAVAILFVRKVR